MQDEVMLLFRELADLSPAAREEYFRQHTVSPDMRPEVESLLNYGSNTGVSLSQALGSEVRHYLENDNSVWKAAAAEPTG